MKFLFDIFPVIVFFIAYKLGSSNPEQTLAFVTQYFTGVVSGGVIAATQAPILLASAVTIIATFAQIGYLLARRKKVDMMLWVSLAVVVVFGGATIYFHNDVFIKWKPTILYWCFGASLLIGQLVLKKNLIRKAMEEQIELPDVIWNKLGLAWGCFFVLQGILNLLVAFNFQTETWVSYKLYGGIGLMLVFIVVQSVVLAKYMKDPE